MDIWYILIVLEIIPFAKSSGTENCKNRSSSDCCEDYHKEGFLCKPCIGSFGVNCSGGFCTSGYYGHGCKEVCHCGTILCDRKLGCTKDNGHGVYHHWIFIVFGVLAMNSILITIAVNGFISTRQRDIPAEQENSLETPKRKGKLNIYVDALLRRVRRSPSDDDDDDTDTESQKDGYLAMRMSMAPPKDGIHQFSDRAEEEDDDDLDNYVEMNLQPSSN
ncbi:uncharacterized protein LOC125657596 [Ostrea edulis]|uniref:uncharacterized protein LOC125657596 n=1 Tax=Ostrea edulis TaxID=37623 RepID=UPI0024AEF410|nr:uncharacterized protein LOC125657596 [Ostrea edulis]